MFLEMNKSEIKDYIFARYPEYFLREESLARWRDRDSPPSQLLSETASANLWRGIGSIELGNLNEAIQCFDKALEINPKYLFAYYLKGVFLSELNNNEKAIQSFDNALEINPNYAPAYVGKGRALSLLKKDNEAIQSFDKALEINPKYLFAYYLKGVSLTELMNYEKAIQSFDKALDGLLEIDPNYDAPGNHNLKNSLYIGKERALSGMGDKRAAWTLAMRVDSVLNERERLEEELQGLGIAIRLGQLYEPSETWTMGVSTEDTPKKSGRHTRH